MHLERQCGAQIRAYHVYICLSFTSCSRPTLCVCCVLCHVMSCRACCPCCTCVCMYTGSHGFMRVHPPHADLEHHMQLVGAQRFAEVEDRDDDRLVRTWLAAKCQQDFRWC